MLLKNNQSHRFTAASATTRNIHLINLTTAEHGEAHVIWMKRNISGEWKQENQFPHEVGSAPTSRLWNSDWKERDGVRIWYQTNIQSDRVNLLFTLLFWIKYLLCCSSFSSSGLSGRKKTQSTRSAEPHLGSPSGSEDLFCYQTRRRKRSLLSESDHEPWRRRRLKHNLNRRCQTEAKPSASAAARHSNVNAH